MYHIFYITWVHARNVCSTNKTAKVIPQFEHYLEYLGIGGDYHLSLNMEYWRVDKSIVLCAYKTQFIPGLHDGAKKKRVVIKTPILLS